MDKTHKLNEHSVTYQHLAELIGVNNANVHFSQSGEDIFLLRHFYQKKNGVYVDIGCYSPTRYSNTFLLHHLYGWSGINIDPSLEVITEFNSSRPRDTNIQAGVGRPAEREFHIFDSTARSTFSEENVLRQKNLGTTKELKTERIILRELKEILKENLKKGQKIDLFDIDVEGLEIEVLETNDWSKYRPEVILIEDYSIAEDKPSKSKIHSFLTKKDYRLISHMYDTSAYLDNKSKQSRLKAINRESFMANLRATNSIEGAKDLEQQKEESKKLSKQLIAARKEIDNLRSNNNKLNKTIEGYDTSLSWRITSPLRAANKVIHGAGDTKSTASPSSILVVGCGHSGTSILTKLISEHSQVHAVDGETGIFNKKWSNKEYAEHFVDLEKSTKRSGASVWVEKTPNHIQCIEKINKLLPQSKIVAITRDPRDVACSIKARGQSFEDGLKRWIKDNQALLEQRSDSSVLTIRLEDLTGSPKDTMKQIFKFLNLKYENTLNHTANKKNWYAGAVVTQKPKDTKGHNHEKNRNWQINQPLFKSTSRYEVEMTPDDEKIYEKYRKEIQDIGKNLGYRNL